MARISSDLRPWLVGNSCAQIARRPVRRAIDPGRLPLKKRPKLLHSLRRADSSGCRLSCHQIADARSSGTAHGSTNGAAGGDRRRVIHTLASVQSGLELGLFNLPGLFAAAPTIVFQRE
jgi:hypothetical protein